MVAECGREKITIRERDRKTLRSIENEKMQDPCGVATGPDGATYRIAGKSRWKKVSFKKAKGFSRNIRCF